MLETINYHEGHDLVPTPSRGGTNVLNVASAKSLDFDIEMQPTGYFSPDEGHVTQMENAGVSQEGNTFCESLLVQISLRLAISIETVKFY